MSVAIPARVVEKLVKLRMKSTLGVLACIVALAFAVALPGCATNGSKELQPAQIAAVVCPQVNLVTVQFGLLNTALQADPKTAAVGKKGAAQLAAAQPVINGVCAGAAAAPAVNAATLQTLIATGFPALSTLAASLPLTPAQEGQVQAALAIAQAAAGVVSIVQQQVAPAPASSAK